MIPSPVYTTVAIYGMERERRPVGSRDTFLEIVNAALKPLLKSSCELGCRGNNSGPLGKSIAPRKGPLNPARLKAWAESIGNGHFLNLEVYDKRWMEGDFFSVYASVNKMWGYDKQSKYYDENQMGPENCITIAVQEDLYDNVQHEMISSLLELFPMVDGCYGYVARSELFGTPHGSGFQRCIVDRYREGNGNDYRSNGVIYPWDTTLPYLYWANIVHQRHLSSAFDIAAIAEWVAEHKDLGNGYCLLKFVGDPKKDAELHRHLEPYFNLVPPEKPRVAIESKSPHGT